MSRRFVRRCVAGGAVSCLVGAMLAFGAGVTPAFAATASVKYTSATEVAGVPYGGSGNVSGIEVSAASYPDSTAITFSFTGTGPCPSGATLGDGNEAYSSTSTSYATTTSSSGAATAYIYEPGTDPAQAATECQVQAVAGTTTEDTASTDEITIQTDPVFSNAASASVWVNNPDSPVNDSINGSTGFDNLSFDVVAVGDGITTISDNGGLSSATGISGGGPSGGGDLTDCSSPLTDEVECLISGSPPESDAGPTGSNATAYPDTFSTTDVNSNTGTQNFTLDVNPTNQCDITTSGATNGDNADALSGTQDSNVTDNTDSDPATADNLAGATGTVLSVSGSANGDVDISCNPTISGDEAIVLQGSPLADVIGSTTTQDTSSGGGTSEEDLGGSITALADNVDKIEASDWDTSNYNASSSHSPTVAPNTASVILDNSNYETAADSNADGSLTGDTNPDSASDGGADECPPQPALANAGLAFCELYPDSDSGNTAYSTPIAIDLSGTDYSGYSQDTAPNSPSLDLNGSSSTTVSTESLSTPVTLSDADCPTTIGDTEIDADTQGTDDCWWNNADNSWTGTTNYQTSTTDLSASDVTLSGGDLSGTESLSSLGGSATDLQVTPASYAEGTYSPNTLDTGYLTDPALSGSITLPSDLAAGDYTVTLTEPLSSSAGDGDAYLDSSGSISASATLDVTTTSSSTTSTPASAQIAFKSGNTDSAVVTGNSSSGSPTGTVTFYECGPTTLANEAGCTSAGTQVGSPVNLTAGANDTSSASSASFTPTKSGYWCFAAYYSGDSNYAASSDTSTDECFEVGATPTITGFSPSSGKKGTTVTITGTNLEDATQVKIGGVVATITKDRQAVLKVTVPKGAKTGRIKISTDTGKATSRRDFTVT